MMIDDRYYGKLTTEKQRLLSRTINLIRSVYLEKLKNPEELVKFRRLLESKHRQT